MGGTVVSLILWLTENEVVATICSDGEGLLLPECSVTQQN